MKKLTLPLLSLLITFLLSGCGLVEGAFKAGVIFALVIILIVGLLIWLSRIVIKHLSKRSAA